MAPLPSHVGETDGAEKRPSLEVQREVLLCRGDKDGCSFSGLRKFPLTD